MARKYHVDCVLPDGSEEERPYDRVEGERRFPVLNEGEEIAWIEGDARPHIVVAQ